MRQDYDGVIAIVFRRSKPIQYALINNQKTGNITFPSGGKEHEDTSVFDTLEREIREETGLYPSEYNIIKTPIVHTFIYGSKKKERAGQTAMQPVFLIEATKTDLKPLDLDSVIDGWYTADEVKQRLTFPDSKEIFEKAIKYL